MSKVPITRCIFNEILSQFGLHIIIYFFSSLLRATVASMLRKTYTRNNNEEKNMPILTNIGIQIRIDEKKKMEIKWGKNCVIHVKICSNLKTNMHILPFCRSRSILSFFFIHTFASTMQTSRRETVKHLI